MIEVVLLFGFIAIVLILLCSNSNDFFEPLRLSCPPDNTVVIPCNGPCGAQTQVISTGCPAVYTTISCPVGFGDPCACDYATLQQGLDPFTVANMKPCGPSCDQAIAGQQCNVECNSLTSAGVSLTSMGSGLFTCLADGTWGHSPNSTFSCVISEQYCPNITNGRGQNVFGNCVGATDGDVCSIRCHLDYTTQFVTSTCTNGQWDVPNFGCQLNGCS